MGCSSSKEAYVRKDAPGMGQIAVAWLRASSQPKSGAKAPRVSVMTGHWSVCCGPRRCGSCHVSRPGPPAVLTLLFAL